jgi:hypothetical protein
MDTLSYKCYNGGCAIFKDIESFFSDFGISNKLTKKEKDEIRDIIEENKGKRKSIYGNIDIDSFFSHDISEILIKRSHLMKTLDLQEIDKSKIQRYIQRRNQKLDNRFAWDDKKEKLFLFNLNPNDQIIGLQIRNMHSIKGGAKYLTYKLSGIYEKLLNIKDPLILEKAKAIDPISHVFGIGFLDFSLPITIFEGPMDSWLWNNAAGLCSLENKFPFEIEGIRYWYDWDSSGRGKTVELLSQGFTVFNWGKFLEENEITKNRKWDLNDIVIHLKATGKKIKRFDNYFTNDPLDLRYFIGE